MEAALLAGAVLGGMRLSPDLEANVSERAGGNPFFVEELLRALRESGGLVEQRGTMTLAPGAAERLPSTLTEVLLSRLDRLDGQVRSVAQVASVIGRSFAVRLLAQVMERQAATLETPLAALQQAEIAFPKGGSDLEYVFKHVTLREVAYNTLVQRRRKELHLQTARAIALLYPSDEYVEVITYHYARTDEDHEAAHWLERAGDRAAGLYATETAVAHYGEAGKRWERAAGTPHTLARLNEKLGDVLATAGRYDEAIPLLDLAIDTYRQVRDLDGAGTTAASLGQALSQRGTPHEGLARVEPLVEMLAWSGPSPALASLQLALARIFQNLGRYEDMLVAGERAVEIAGAIGNDRLLGSALERRGTALNLVGRVGESRSILEGAIPLLERVGDLGTLHVVLTNIGEAHRLAGGLEDARFFNERALEVVERVGNVSSLAFILMNLGEILLSMGQWAEAREYLERADGVLANHPSASRTAPFIQDILGEILLHEGDWQRAEQALQRALTMAEATKERQALEYIHVSLAELDVLRGESGAAIARLTPLTAGEGISLVLIEVVLAWAHLEHGDVEQAGVLAAGSVDRARDQGEMLVMVDALRVQGMVLARQGQREEATGIFEEGAALSRSLPYPYAEARILHQLGVLEQEQGNPARARERLEEALKIYQRLGAKKDVQQLERVLATLR